jgi:hypothetical protein
MDSIDDQVETQPDVNFNYAIPIPKLPDGMSLLAAFEAARMFRNEMGTNFCYKPTLEDAMKLALNLAPYIDLNGFDVADQIQKHYDTQYGDLRIFHYTHYNEDRKSVMFKSEWRKKPHHNLLVYTVCFFWRKMA